METTPLIPTSQTPNSRNKKILFISLIVIVAAVLIGIFVSLNKNRGISHVNQPITPPSTTTPSSDSLPTIITPPPITTVPKQSPETEDEFYLQVGESFKTVFR